jgi:hypothetical protein
VSTTTAHRFGHHLLTGIIQGSEIDKLHLSYMLATLDGEIMLMYVSAVGTIVREQLILK